MTILYSSEKRSLKWYSCCIICNLANCLTAKPMPTLLVDDRIKAKLIELRFRCHIPANRPY